MRSRSRIAGDYADGPVAVLQLATHERIRVGAHPPSHVHVIHLVAYEGPESGRTAGRRTLPRCLMDMLAEVDIIGHNVRGDCMRLVHDFNVDFDADVQISCDTMQYARMLLGLHSPSRGTPIASGRLTS